MLRRAFTLIELLVVVSVVGILGVMVLAGTQGVRAATRTLQCKNHLKQIGTAVASYHSAIGCYPLTTTDRGEIDSDRCGSGFYSWRAHLLPYLDQHAVHEQINFDVPMTDDCGESGHFTSSHPNFTAARTVIEVFLCPSDTVSAETLLADARPSNDNYAANFGWPPQSRGIEPSRAKSRTNPYNGVFSLATGNPKNPVAWHPTQGISSRDVTDGLQHTAMVAERLIHGVDPGGVEDPRRHVYCGGSPGPRTQASLVKYCYLVDDADDDLSAGIGQAWISGWAGFAPGYMHLMRPNERGCRDHGAELEGNWWLSASSNHAGGLNILMADGRVAWIDDQIDDRIWWAIGSRDGEEVARLNEE